MADMSRPGIEPGPLVRTEMEAAGQTRGVDHYLLTRKRVEDYFDRSATKVWERLTSDAPVSRIRQTVRAGRDQMRGLILSRLPHDLTDARILDAGCGTGQMTQELANRGANVVGVDISPALIDIARKRMSADLLNRVQFQSGDMLDLDLGTFDHVLAMDSLIYYTTPDITKALCRLTPRVSGSIIFTVAPRTPLLMAMWYAGKLFPRSDRSPTMIPHAPGHLCATCQSAGLKKNLRCVGRIAKGFYISQAMELGA